MPIGDLTITQLLDTILRLGVAGLLLIIIITGAKENPWWVFGNTYRRDMAREQAATERERKEKDEWKTIAMRGTSLAMAGATAAEKNSSP